MKKFADILNATLESQERSNRWLSEKTGINPTSIGDYRSGKTVPTIDRAMLIARVLNIDLSEFFSPEEIKNLKAQEEIEKLFEGRKEGTIEIPLFSDGAALLSASNQSKMANSVDLKMAREKFVAPESLRHDGAYAAKVDHLYDCDEEYNLIVVWPFEGEIKSRGVLIFTERNESKRIYIRRIIEQFEENRFVLNTAYSEKNIINIEDIKILGVVKFKGEWV